MILYLKSSKVWTSWKEIIWFLGQSETVFFFRKRYAHEWMAVKFVLNAHWHLTDTFKTKLLYRKIHSQFTISVSQLKQISDVFTPSAGWSSVSTVWSLYVQSVHINPEVSTAPFYKSVNRFTFLSFCYETLLSPQCWNIWEH